MSRRIVVALGVVILSLLGLALIKHRDLLSRTSSISTIVPSPSYRAARTQFPYSVIPGGVLNSAELNASIERDPVVRLHYNDINPNRLVPARMPRPTLAYVSYRIGSDVRWTRNKVAIPAGELVLSDGRNFVRARCGNRVRFYSSPEASAEAKRNPIPPIEDPPLDLMEAGMPGVMKMQRLPAPPLVPATADGPIALNTPPGIYWPPGPPPPVWCCSAGPEPPPVIPGSPVPEPSTFVLLAAGLGALAARLRR